jgi:hypothetical protein
MLGNARSLIEMEEITHKLTEKIKKELGDIEYEAELTDQSTNAEGTSSQYYRSIPYWRCQPLVRQLPSEQVATIWASKDNKYRMGFLQQQAAKRYFVLLLNIILLLPKACPYSILNLRKKQEKANQGVETTKGNDVVAMPPNAKEEEEKISKEEGAYSDQNFTGKRKFECVDCGDTEKEDSK